MRRFLIAAAVWLFGCAAALAQQTGPIYCGVSAFATIPVASNNATVIPAPGTGSSRTYICGYTVNSTAAGSLSFVYSTTANCGGATPVGTTLVPQFSVAATAVSGDPSFVFRGLEVPPNGGNVCISSSASPPTGTVIFYYAQY